MTGTTEDAAPVDPHAIEAGFFSGAGALNQDVEDQLSELQARYRGVIDHLPAIVYIDGIGDVDHMIDVSPAIASVLGISREDWLNDFMAWERIIHPDDRDRVVEASWTAVQSGEPFHVQYRAHHADGRPLWIREDSVLVRDEQGQPLYWLGLMLDVTELVQTRSGLKEAQERYEALVEHIPAIVYQDLCNESWETVYVSPQLRAILGVEPADWVGSDSTLWAQMLHPQDRARAQDEVERGIASGQSFSVEYRMVADDGRVVWFQDSALILPGTDGRPAMIQGVMLDITERKEAEDRLAYLAYHDAETGLPNKAMFDELLDLALARARRNDTGVAVLSLDVDNFKLVNDSLGHEAGDRLIKQLAERLREAVRESDLIARQGGDEFLLLLADIDKISPVADVDGVTIAAESVILRVRDALAEPFRVGETELYVSASIGVALWPRDGEDVGDLMRGADAAMFRAKASGPGSHVFHQQEGADALSKLSLSTRLRRAVDDKVWQLHYQPLVDLHDASMFGVEALIRWPDPNGGLVPPGEFIPLAEEMGLIDAIGEWVVEELCRQDEAWRAEGIELDIGFNLSPRQLSQADPVARIADLITGAGMDPSRVTVEITESTAMNDPERVIELLRGFKDRGFQLAIDDFGTGYSSLARLRYMPVDILKIDRTFVRDVHADSQSASMVSAIIALANNLGMLPLAEGIETEQEWDFLADRGCPFGQGFYFSRPVPASEISALVRRGSLSVIDGGIAS